MQQLVEKFLNEAGIAINGSNEYDFLLNDSRAIQRIVKEQSIGLGESYMDHQWDCHKLDVFFEKIFTHHSTKEKSNLKRILLKIKDNLLNLQSIVRAPIVAEQHYDLDNNLYEKMLGEYMAYSCGYFLNETTTLDEAQKNKFELICKKLDLQPGMEILDVGCGFGSFMKYAAEKYQVKCTGITLSKEQMKYGAQINKGLPVDIQLVDYRNFENKKFDRIVSIEMFEAVGRKNFRVFMEKMHSLLKEDGLMLIQTISNNETKSQVGTWVDKYIFPNGYMPSPPELMKSFEGLFIIDDLQNFGTHYDKTLMSWYHRFQESWPELEEQYDERFRRMWEFYLLFFAGGFRARTWQLHQVLFSKPKSKIKENLRVL